MMSKLMEVLASVGLTLMCFGAFATEPLKIGFVYNSPVGDAGWTYQHDEARLAVESTLGNQVSTTFVESVAVTDIERVLRQLVNSGHRLIFTTSFGFMNPTIKVAKSAPQVKFQHATGYKQADNVSIYHARTYEARYLSGVLAGKMSRTGIAGFIASFPIPEVVRGINAFTIGMRSVNPQAQVKVVWISSWFHPGRETDAANVLISHGVDVINQFTDSGVPTQVAQKEGVYSISVGSDRHQFGPDAHLSSVIYDWSGFYTQVAQSVIDGDWISDNVWGGISAGMTDLSPLHTSVPRDVAEMIETLRQEIMDGKRHPFQGPVKDQSGGIKVVTGSVLSDDDLLSMNWYVEGVQGKLPN